MTLVTSDPTAFAIVCTSGANPAERAAATASTTTFACGARYIDRHDGRHRLGEQLDEPAGQPGEVAAVGHPVVADRLGPLDGDARRCTGSSRSSGLSGSPAACSAAIGQVSSRTSSKPRVSATSARLRASPEWPQITGSARTTITSRRAGVVPLPTCDGARHGPPAAVRATRPRRTRTAAARRAPQPDGCGPELEVQDAAAVHVRGAAGGCRPAAFPFSVALCTYCTGGVVVDAVGADRGLDVAAGLDDELAVGDPDRGPLERGGVDEEQALARRSGTARARPRRTRRTARRSRRCPAARRARCPTARSAPRARPPRCGRAGRRSGRPRGPPCRARCSGPRSGSRAYPAGISSAPGRGPGCSTGAAPIAEERVEHGDEGLVAAGEADPRGHVVQQPERVVPLAALVELRVAQQAGAGFEGVDPAAAEGVELVGEAGVAQRAGDRAVQW